MKHSLLLLVGLFGASVYASDQKCGTITKVGSSGGAESTITFKDGSTISTVIVNTYTGIIGSFMASQKPVCIEIYHPYPTIPDRVAIQSVEVNGQN